MLVVAVLLAVQAIFAIQAGEQACFMHYPAVACPAGDDPAIVRLTFAFFGVPLIWLAGIVLATVARAWQRRRGAVSR